MNGWRIRQGIIEPLPSGATPHPSHTSVAGAGYILEVLVHHLAAIGLHFNSALEVELIVHSSIREPRKLNYFLTISVLYPPPASKRLHRFLPRLITK
jgi:hypothetical protein